jgi:hypothetical protein
MPIDALNAGAYAGFSMDVSEFPSGGYRFIHGVFQYSGGVAAAPGYRIVRVRFQSPVPLAEGFRRIESILTAAGRPLAAFCACELRSPKPFTEDGFRAFNKVYVVTLERWGIVEGERNPIARSNVCPEIDPPNEPSLYAFSYTVPETNGGALPAFVISGSAESAEGSATYVVVRPNDTSPEGMRVKAVHVLGAMERRLQALGFAWSDTTATQVYSVRDIHPFVGDELVRRGAARAGLTWHYCRPPVTGLEYEMDCRAVTQEHVIAAHAAPL